MGEAPAAMSSQSGSVTVVVNPLYKRKPLVTTPSRSMSINSTGSGSTGSEHGPAKEGYLVKQGFVDTGYRKRWFVLRGVRLQYFKTRDSQTEQGYIDLTLAAVDALPVASDSGINAFYIATPERLWRLGAATLLEMQEWISAIREERRRHIEFRLTRLALPWTKRPTDSSITPPDAYAWGDGSRGQLGHGLKTTTGQPQALLSLQGLLLHSVAAGLHCSAAVDCDGALYMWGSGDCGRLGVGDCKDAVVPMRVDGLRVQQVALGLGAVAAAVTTDGALYTWGEDLSALVDADGPTRYTSVPGRVTALDAARVRAVAVGAAHVAAITGNGTLVTWGRGSDGRLGHGGEWDWGTPRPVDLLTGHRVVAVSCGAAHTGVVTEDGQLFMFGRGDCGQLGHGDRTTHRLPRRVEALAADIVRKVACGAAHTLAVNHRGEVFAMGDNSRGQLGIGSEHPVASLPARVTALQRARVQSVACGAMHSLAVTLRGELYVWGAGTSGQLGLSLVDRPTPMLLGSVFPVSCVAGGDSHSLALTCTPAVVVACASGEQYVGGVAVDNDALLRHGRGRCYDLDDGKYTGEWVDDKRHGIGTMRQPRHGVRYDGEWVADLYHGFGVLRDADTVYTGQFAAGQRHGAGREQSAAGEVVGVWVAGVRQVRERAAAAAAAATDADVGQGRAPPPEGALPMVSAARTQLQVQREKAKAHHSILRDKYGFKIEQKLVDDFRMYLSTYYAGRLAQQKESWRRFFARTDLDAALETREGLSVLKQLVRQGIPAELRGELWQLISSSKRRRLAMPGYYASLQEQAGPTATITSQIDRDLDRTFPHHLIYEIGEGQRRLRRVLLSYARHNPHIGYCQSMNFICALLLLFMDEEATFWMLVTLVEDMVPEYYTPLMIGIRTDTDVLDELIADKLPRIHAHLRQFDIHAPMFATQWLLCLFVNTLPTETVLRVWDCMFLQGRKVLFRVALALLQMHEAAICGAHSLDELMSTLTDCLRRLIDCDQLIKVAFKNVSLFNKKRMKQVQEEKRTALQAASV